MTLKHTLLIGLLGIGSMAAQAKSLPGVVAHRGYWKTQDTYENTLSSLKNAINIGAEGSECDLNITRDGRIILFHDPSYNGKRIEDMTYAQSQSYTLRTGEKMPLLEDYLAIAAKQYRTTPILELKGHSTPEREDALVDSVLHLVRVAGMQGRVEYISFSRHICERLIAKDSSAKVAYLTGDLSPLQLKDLGYTGLDYGGWIFNKNPEWIDQAHALGLEVNVWCIDNPKEMQFYIDKGIKYITTDEPVILQQLLKKQ